jgi:hypothetical protein
MAAAVAAAVVKAAHDANEANFITAIERTLRWEIAALVVIFLVSFLLPRWPRKQADLVAAGVEAI